MPTYRPVVYSLALTNFFFSQYQLISFITKDFDSNICEPEEGYPDVKRIMRKPDFEVNGNEEVCTYRTTTAGKDKIVDSSSNPEGKVNPPKAEKVPVNIFLLFNLL